jgi:uroporphyrinogen decarboxylase
LTSKERVLTAIEHRQPDRVPVDFGAHGQVCVDLRRYLGLPQDASLHALFEVDLAGVGPAIKQHASPICYADPTREVTPDGLFIDLWGVGFRRAQTPTGEYIDIAHHPLAGSRSLADLQAHTYMSPDDWDYAGIRAAAESLSQYAVGVHCRGTFEISWFIRGMDDLLLDLALEPAKACAVLDRVQQPLLERLRRILEAGGDAVDIAEYNDDVGSQNGLLVSPEMWRRYLKPRIAEVFALVRSHGRRVRYHSCGAVRDILPDLIDLGLDILNPVQPLARGMEPTALKRDFGRHLTFHGGIDMQDFLPRARGPGVRDETRRLLDILNADGGWIACASHNLQPDTPPANIVAMYEVLLGHEIVGD